MSEVPPVRDVMGVAVIGDYELRLLFDDGLVGDVSFVGRKWTGVFTPLRDLAEFGKVTLAHGSVCWPDHGLDMAPEALYEAAKANALTPA